MMMMKALTSPLPASQIVKNAKRRRHLFPISPNVPESKKCPSVHLKIFLQIRHILSRIS